MVELDTQSNVRPIGLLPELDYGVPMTGFELDGPYLTGVSQIGVTPNFTTYFTGYTRDDDLLLYLRIQIEKIGSSDTSKHIITGITDPNLIDIEPPLPNDYQAGDPVKLIPIPIQGRVISGKNELDRGRMIEGQVGNSQYKSYPLDGGKMGNFEIEMESGQDFFKYDDNFYAFSSLKALCLTPDGKIPTDGSGSINIRSPTSSAIKSFSLFYSVNRYYDRTVKGCIVSKFSQNFEEDLHSHISETYEVLYKDLILGLPDNTLSPDVVYKKYSLRSHGHTQMKFYHGMYLKEPVGPGESSNIPLTSVLGLEDDDEIRFTLEATGYTFDTVITSIDTANKTIDINPATPLGVNWTEGDTVQQTGDFHKPRRIVSMELEFNNNGLVLGDIRSGEGSPTTAVAGGSDYQGKATFERKTLDQIGFMLNYESNEDLWFRQELQLAYDKDYLIDFLIDFEGMIKSNPNDNLKSESEVIKDEISFQISNLRSGKIGKIV